MNFMHVLLSFLNREHYQIYYAPVARYLKSVDAAIIFSELAQRHQFHEVREELITIPGKGGGWFYHTQDSMEERLVLGRKTQDRSIEILIRFRLVEVIKHGLPCKRYFRINPSGFEELSKYLSSLSKTDKLECPKRTNRNDPLGQTEPYIEEPNKEPNKESKGDKPPDLPASLQKKENKVEREIHVLTSIKEHEDLIEKHGVDLTTRAYKKLSEWKQNTPKYKWKKSDKISIDNWVVDAVLEEEVKIKKRTVSTEPVCISETVMNNKTWFKKIGAKYNQKAKDNSVFWTDFFEYLQFNDHIKNQKSEKIYYKDIRFREKIENELRNRSLI